MTTTSTLQRRREDKFLWSHSLAFFIVLMLSCMLIPSFSWILFGIPKIILGAWLLSAGYYVLAAPWALHVARKNRVVPSQWVATYPLLGLALTAVSAFVAHFGGPLSGFGWMGLGCTALFVMAGAMVTIALAFHAQVQLSRELRQRTVFQLGCGSDHAVTTESPHTVLDSIEQIREH